MYGNAVFRPLVTHLRAENRLALGDRHIEHPERYFRQYFQVVRKGKRLVYVNAFRDATPNTVSGSWS
jgi:hypothetical protein